MKALVVNEPNKIEIVDRPIPVIEDEQEILIKVKAAGICGSDISIYGGKSPVATYPRILGHEVVGVVEKTGSKADKFQVGDHVIVKQTESCGECYACRHGRENVCVDLKVRGVTIDGGYREYVTVPESSAYRLPKDLEMITAVMVEPFTIAFQACKRGRLAEDDMLLVYGAGALGSTIIQVAKSFGATIIAVDIDDVKLEQAKGLGAQYVINSQKEKVEDKLKEYTGHYGPTISIDTVCNPKSVEFLIDNTGNAGRVVLMGFDTRASEIPQFKITARELDIIGSRLQYDNFDKVIELFANKSIDPKEMISHVFKYDEIHKAMSLVESRQFRKIILTF